jgi:phosphate regulon transcriptional regulator PhoB
MASKILIVEDDSDIVELLTYNLREAGFETEAVFNGADALERAVEEQPDLIILDLMLPEVDGFEVCRLLKQDTQTADIPIIMLTAKAEEIDRVIGLQLGADDYVTKPFSQREFVLRVRAVLRRTTAEQTPSSVNQLEISGLRIDIDKHKVFNEQGEIELTATEFKMLVLFAGAPGRVFSRSVLMDSIWGQDYYGIDRTVDTHISRLRRKLGRFGERIETVHGVGYRFKE